MKRCIPLGIGRGVLSLGVMRCTDTPKVIGGGTTISLVLVGSAVNKIG